MKVNIALLTVTDTRTIDNDKSGGILVKKIKEANHNLIDRKICKDNKDDLRSEFFIDSKKPFKFRIANKKQLLQDIANVASEHVGIPNMNIAKSLQQREILGPTGIGKSDFAFELAKEIFSNWIFV